VELVPHQIKFSCNPSGELNLSDGNDIIIAKDAASAEGTNIQKTNDDRFQKGESNWLRAR
jgi:hypothetical protein